MISHVKYAFGPFTSSVNDSYGPVNSIISTVPRDVTGIKFPKYKSVVVYKYNVVGLLDVSFLQ